MSIGAVIVGLILLFFHLLILCVILGNLKRMIVCTETIVAKVKYVDEKQHKHEDSKTGKVKYDYSYEVTFQYDYNGQIYESEHNYSNHCRYSKNQNTDIKINPHNPEESWTKGELIDILKLSLSIPLLVFFDLIYINAFFL